MEHNFSFSFQTVASIDQLSEAEQQLMLAAQAACNHSYAPYSHYHVGCAIQMKTGEIVQGSNQENAAYPSGMCAERTAIFSASNLYPHSEIAMVAITARKENSNLFLPVTPCGPCRQVMLEYELKQPNPIRLMMELEEGRIAIIPNTQSLLPFSFNKNNLD